MNEYRIVEQVKRKPKAFSGVLKKIMVIFAVIFVLIGIMIHQGFMLPGFLLVLLYFGFDIFSHREYEYVLEGKNLEIFVILGKRYRKKAHILNLSNLEAAAPAGHAAVAAYRKNGGKISLPKFDYTSYDENTPYYTMIITEGRQKIKILLDLNEEMLQSMKKMYPDKIYTAQKINCV